MLVLSSLIVLLLSSIILNVYRNSISFYGAVVISSCVMIFLNISTSLLLTDIQITEAEMQASAFLVEQVGLNNYITITFAYVTQTTYLAFTVSSGGFMVLIYAYVDMNNERDGVLFISQIQTFIFFMISAILSEHLLIFTLGWEGIGLASLFLVGFWSERQRSFKATVQIFIFGKFGDIFFFFSVIWVCHQFETFSFSEMNAKAILMSTKYINIFGYSVSVLYATAFLLVFSAAVKSVFGGFHTWLIFAMEAPTGASALMHSSTLVIAGHIFLLKLQGVLDLVLPARMLLCVWGLLTLLIASWCALTSYEIKPIMAYSTIGNMGLITILIGLMAYENAIFVILCHAYIKICLFILTGILIKYAGGVQDIRFMGGLLPFSPTLYLAFIAAISGLMGVPFLSGYFCKYYALIQLSKTRTLEINLLPLLGVSFVVIYIFCINLIFLIFISSKNSHSSLYRTWLNSFLMVLVIWVCLALIILFVDTYPDMRIQSGQLAFDVYWNQIDPFPQELSYWTLLKIYALCLSYFLYTYLYTLNININFLRVIRFVLFVFIFLGVYIVKIFQYSGFWHKFKRHVKYFCNAWLFTTNHKKLGLMYIFFAFWSGLFGTSLSTLIRLELSQPGSEIFLNQANLYHVVISIHAIVMIFFLVTPFVFGGLGNYFLPIHVGSRDVAYPRLNNFGLWLLPTGLIFILRTLWVGFTVNSSNVIHGLDISAGSWYFSSLTNEIELYTNLINEFKIPDNNFNILSYISLYAQKFEIFNADILPIQLLTSVSLFTNIVDSNPTNTMAGWTFTTPFSHSLYTGSPVDWAFAGLLFSTISTNLTFINLIVTWRYLKGRGAKYQKEFYPILLLSIFLSIRMLILVSPILLAGLIMLMGDRYYNTAFFTVRAGGDLLLFQHLFWFFGHPEVYILIIPAFGMASTIIPYYVQKPLISKMHMVYAMHAIGSMGFVVWGHHMYLVGIDNKARILFFVITVMIALPASIKVCGWMTALVNSTVYMSTELFFTMSFIGLFIVGGISGSFCAHAGTDIILHDTYYIVGHFHIMLSGAMLGMFFGFLYFHIKEWSGISYSNILGYTHAITHFLGHILTFMPMLWLGYGGMPRRVQDYPWGFAGWHSVASVGHFFVLYGIGAFLLNCIFILYMKKTLHSENLGFPGSSNRLIYLTKNKYLSKTGVNSKNILGLRIVRHYLL